MNYVQCFVLKKRTHAIGVRPLSPVFNLPALHFYAPRTEQGAGRLARDLSAEVSWSQRKMFPSAS